MHIALLRCPVLPVRASGVGVSEDRRVRVVVDSGDEAVQAGPLSTQQPDKPDIARRGAPRRQTAPGHHDTDGRAIAPIVGMLSRICRVRTGIDVLVASIMRLQSPRCSWHTTAYHAGWAMVEGRVAVQVPGCRILIGTSAHFQIRSAPWCRTSPNCGERKDARMALMVRKPDNLDVGEADAPRAGR